MAFTKSILTLLAITLLISCKKKNINTEPVLQDTLNGWERITDSAVTVNDIMFTSDQNGFAVSSRGILKSIDGGKSWRPVTDTGVIYGYDNLMKISPTMFFANSQQSITYSFDGGATWTRRAQVFNFNAKDLFFVSPSTGYVTAERGLYKTIDTGKTWQKQIDANANGLWFFNSGKGIVNINDIIYTTTDGISWSKGAALQYSGDRFYYFMMDFVDDLYGWHCADNKIHKTIDGGATWTTTVMPTKILDIDFINRTTGFYCTNNEIYKTTDGGNNWSRVCKIVKGTLIEIYFLDENTGWACGQFRTLLRYKK